MLSEHALEAAATAVSLALDNARLQQDLTTSIDELAASRKRVAWAADEERRRIEQDLHDGAQQGLVALRIKLSLLEDLATEDPESIAPALAEAGERVDKALDHIRSLAKGIYPAALRDLGLAYALGAVVRGAGRAAVRDRRRRPGIRYGGGHGHAWAHRNARSRRGDRRRAHDQLHPWRGHDRYGRVPSSLL